MTVALRKESVDRNPCFTIIDVKGKRSLSARRAWIEIRCAIRPATGRPTSLSARRAWIEINVLSQPGKPKRLSLSARRAWIEISVKDLNAHLY